MPASSRSSPASLIVNADDFGLTEGVNQAIFELYRAGALSSASLMANGAAFADAAATAKNHPGLGVGCHVVLVDGTPVSDSVKISSLLGKNGRLRSSLREFVIDLQLGHISEEAIVAEATAQICKLQRAGISPTHIDTHKHTHMFPQVARPLLLAAHRCGITSVRNPFEEPWSTGGTLTRRLEVSLLRIIRPYFLKLVQQFGMHTTDGSLGIAATGRLDALTLRTLLQAAPPGQWELVCHPGYHDTALDLVHTRLRSSRDTERLALAQEIPRAVLDSTIHLCNFGKTIVPV